MFKVGITERGDASLDLDWLTKLNSGEVDIAVIISKNISAALHEGLLQNKANTIFHLTCTGMGGTIIEPNVPTFKELYEKAVKLIKEGYPVSQIVLRTDPIIPTSKGIETFKSVLTAFKNTGISRVRFSFIDMYPHVKTRFEEKNIPIPFDGFSASKSMCNKAIDVIRQFEQTSNYKFESCAEYNDYRRGCISERDLEILGLEPTLLVGNSKQRKGCLCPSNKIELLNCCNQCGHKCLYCYWKSE